MTDTSWGVAPSSNVSAVTWSSGSSNPDAARRRCLDDLLGRPEGFLLDPAVADRQALRLQKRVRHRAADQHRLATFDQAVEHPELVGDLGAADDRDERLHGLRQDLPEVVELLLHQKTSPRVTDEADHARRRSVRPVGGPEGVVDVDVDRLRQRPGEVFVILLFAGLKAQILEQQNLPLPQVDHVLSNAVTHAVVGEDHLAPQQPRQVRADGLQREVRVAFCPSDARGATRERPGRPARARGGSSAARPGCACRRRPGAPTSAER